MRRYRERAVIAAVALGDVLLLSYLVADAGAYRATPALVLAGVYAALSLASLRLPRGEALHGGAGIIVAGILSVGGATTAIGVALGGTAAILVSHRAADEDDVSLDVVRAPLLVLAAAWSWTEIGAPAVATGSRSATLVAYMGFAACYVLVDLVTYSVLSSVISGERILPGLGSFLRLAVGVHLGMASIGVALALTYDPESALSTALSGAILVALMLIMKHNFGIYLQIRTAYSRTVGVLARLAEFEREETRGHSERVADIATGIGRKLRIPNRELERLNLAALLHAIGRVGSPADLEGGLNHATLGARIASNIEFLAPVALVVEMHHCSPEQARSSMEARLAHIVGVACKFDQLVTQSHGQNAERIALEVMRHRPGEFDQSVVAALRASRGV